MEYAHGSVVVCFVLFMISLISSFRVALQALHSLYECPSASEGITKNLSKIVYTLPQQHKANYKLYAYFFVCTGTVEFILISVYFNKTIDNKIYI